MPSAVAHRAVGGRGRPRGAHHVSYDAAAAYLSEQVGIPTIELSAIETGGHVPSEWSLANQEDVAERIVNWLGMHLGVARSEHTF